MEPKLKVFLSSAQFEEEFLVERELIPFQFSKEPLHSAFFLWKIEDYSSPKKPREQYTKNVKDSDLLLILLGKNLRDAVVEEFNAAKSKGIPIFAFLQRMATRSKAMDKFITDKLYPAVTATEYASTKELTKILEDSLLNYYFRNEKGPIYSGRATVNELPIKVSDGEERILRLLVGILDTKAARITRDKVIESLILQAVLVKGGQATIDDINNSVIKSVREDYNLELEENILILEAKGNLERRGKSSFVLESNLLRRLEKKSADSEVTDKEALEILYKEQSKELDDVEFDTYSVIVSQVIAHIAYHTAFAMAAAEFLGDDNPIPYDAQEINRLASHSVSIVDKLPGTISQWQQSVIEILKHDNPIVTRWISRTRKAYWLLASLGYDPKGVTYTADHFQNYVVYLDSHIAIRAMVAAGGGSQLCVDMVDLGNKLSVDMRLSTPMFGEVNAAFEGVQRAFYAAGQDPIRAKHAYEAVGRRSDILDGYFVAVAANPSLKWDSYINQFYSPIQRDKLQGYIESELGIKIEDETSYSVEQYGQIEEICSALLEQRNVSQRIQGKNNVELERQYLLRTNEARQMAIVYTLRQDIGAKEKQYWFVTFDEYVYKTSVDLAKTGESFYSFPCYMKPGRWLEILSAASPGSIDINVFKEILVSQEIGKVADFIESTVIAQMLEERVDQNITDVKTLRFMFSDIINRPAVQDAYEEVLKAKGAANIDAANKFKDEVINSLKVEIINLKDTLDEKEQKLKSASSEVKSAKGKAKYLGRELHKIIGSSKSGKRKRKR